jgi:hypothetical protein
MAQITITLSEIEAGFFCANPIRWLQLRMSCVIAGQATICESQATGLNQL